jgi:hypothetical protein
MALEPENQANPDKLATKKSLSCNDVNAFLIGKV